ncbi:MAG: TIGR01777 family oxidoreductase [Candidatus Flexifilum sp.]|jgi:uncharacterized protein (TIGR01777 family)
MRVIITGGTGLIGREVANSLANDHHEVIVLSRNTNKTSGLAPGVRVVGWDARTADGWGELADGADAIINLAGESISGEGFLPERWSDEKKKRILESRVNAGRAVVEAIERARVRPRVLLQASAVGYYGQTGDAPVTEESPAGTGFLADVCKQWEASTAAVEAMGVRRVILRIGLPLSMKGGVFTRLIFPFRLFAGGPLGSGQQYQPWIHMDDMVAAVRFLMDNNEASGPFNICAPAPVTNAEMAKAIGRVMKRPSFVPAPAFAFKLGFGEVAQIVLEGNKMIPKRLTDMGFRWQHPHIGEAVADLLGGQKAPTAPAHH